MPRPRSSRQVALRPQDLVVLFRLALEHGPAPTHAALAAELAAELGMTASEVHGAVERAISAQLAHGNRLHIHHLIDFLVLG